MPVKMSEMYRMQNHSNILLQSSSKWGK